LRYSGERGFAWKRKAMHTVEILLNPAELPNQMNAMRAWLDEHGYEPSSFNSREQKGKLLLSVCFRAREAADAFANRFAGQVNGFQADHLLTGFSAPLARRA
jgi:hypothetical protein